MRNSTLTRGLLATVMIAMTSMAQAQEQPKAFGKTIDPGNLTPDGKIRCATTQYEDYLQEKYPERQTRAEFQQSIEAKVQQKKMQRLQKSGNTTNAVVTIPVVVHVIHNGDAIGNNENISDEQVMSQIQVLNEDYRKMMGTPGYNTDPVGADTEIEFCLAQVDPDGNPTTGIDRVQRNPVDYDWNNVEAMQEDTQWDPDDYMNIWVCNIDPQIQLLGFAQFPNNSDLEGAANYNGPADTDGVVISYQYFGSEDIYDDGEYEWPYNKGRTTTHEVGHFFGLEHIWGVGGSNPNCNDSDFCDDTPESNGPNATCQQHFSCGSYDMIENYMDYTNDDCMNIFTEDQKDRMMTVLENSPRRGSLTTSNKCTTTAATEDFRLLNGINVYPNPAQDVLNIAVANGELPDGYAIYNSLGQVMANMKISGETNLAVNTSGYSNGIYFIKIDKGTQSKTLKFVKN